MGEPESWSMPNPPARHVISVRDHDDVELLRYNTSGTLWMDYGDGPAISWDELIYRRGPITADRLAQ
jgi:hypothetical protein